MAISNFLRIAATLLFALPFVISKPAASTIYLEEKQTVFSLNVANDSGDISFRFESPAQHAWVALGIGDKMKGALMLFMYPSKDNKHVTFSPRLSSGDVEPTYSKDIDFDVLDGSSIQNGRIILNAVCHNCRSWNGSSLNVSSTTQPWMYAFGPTANPISSDSVTADLTQHSFYGKFTMDMIQATGPGGVPTASLVSSGVTFEGKKYVNDADFVSVTHGYLMAALVIVCAPLLALHLLSGARLRWMNYTLFILVFLTGWAFGIFDSNTYNRTVDYKTAHQNIGHIVILFLIIMALLRIMQHTRFARNNSWIDPINIWLGGISWILSLVDGFLGIKLAYSKNYIYAIYGCAALAMLLVAVPLMWIVKRRQDRRVHHRKDHEGAGIILTNGS